MKHSTKIIKVSDHDQDIILEWPGGQQVEIQIRPSNADVDNYAGSLDIILPDDQAVVNWEGDDMKPAKASGQAHVRLAKQLVMSMEDSWYEKRD